MSAIKKQQKKSINRNAKKAILIARKRRRSHRGTIACLPASKNIHKHISHAILIARKVLQNHRGVEAGLQTSGKNDKRWSEDQLSLARRQAAGASSIVSAAS